MPRISKRTPELEAEVLERLKQGEPLTVICRDVEVDPSRWRDWCDGDETLAIAYARAREVGFDAIAADTLRIVDDVEEDPASRRVRMDGRLKLLAKWDPKRYGEKLGIGQADGMDAVQAAVTINVIGK